jgi:hypothetical protein
MAIELVPLCTMRLQGKPAMEVGTGPAGTRMIVDCVSVKVLGDRLRGQPSAGAHARDPHIRGSQA